MRTVSVKPLTAVGLLAAVLLRSCGAFPTGAGSCSVNAVHGKKTTGGLSAAFSPATYDSRKGQQISLTLECTVCNDENGFLALAYDSLGRQAGLFVTLPPGSRGTCGRGVTHTRPSASKSWAFTWSPAGTSGPITFEFAVASGFDNSFIHTACLGDDAVTPARNSPWSAEATWGGCPVPAAGSSVAIAPDASVILDVSPPPLKSLTVYGSLRFADDAASLRLQADWIMLEGGELQIGSEQQPFAGAAAIVLTGNTTAALTEDVMGAGSKVLAVMSGHLNLHGVSRFPSWTRLAQSAEAGATRVAVEEPVTWQVGDELGFAPAGGAWDTYEKAALAAVSGDGRLLTLAGPLRSWHAQGGELGRLTRNVVIEGDDGLAQLGFGGRLLFTGQHGAPRPYERPSCAPPRQLQQGAALPASTMPPPPPPPTHSGHGRRLLQAGLVDIGCAACDWCWASSSSSVIVTTDGYEVQGRLDLYRDRAGAFPDTLVSAALTFAKGGARLGPGRQVYVCPLQDSCDVALPSSSSSSKYAASPSSAPAAAAMPSADAAAAPAAGLRACLTFQTQTGGGGEASMAVTLPKHLNASSARAFGLAVGDPGRIVGCGDLDWFDGSCAASAVPGSSTEHSMHQGEASSSDGEGGHHAGHGAPGGGHNNMLSGHITDTYIRISNVELRRMGSRPRGAFPVQWQGLGNAPWLTYLRNSSIHDCANGFVAATQTNGVLLADNVLFNTTGVAGISLQTGGEQCGAVMRNLVVGVNGTAEAAATAAAAPASSRDWRGGASGVVIRSMRNSVVGNVAAGVGPAGGAGVLVAPPRVPPSAAAGLEGDWPITAPPLAFSNNTAHTNAGAGMALGGYYEGAMPAAGEGAAWVDVSAVAAEAGLAPTQGGQPGGAAVAVTLRGVVAFDNGGPDLVMHVRNTSLWCDRLRAPYYIGFVQVLGAQAATTPARSAAISSDGAAAECVLLPRTSLRPASRAPPPGASSGVGMRHRRSCDGGGGWWWWVVVAVVLLRR